MTRFAITLRSLVLIALLAVVSLGTATAQEASPAAGSDIITIIGGKESPVDLTLADLQALPVESLDVTYTASGEPQNHTFTGTSLFGVIDSIGLDVAEDARNPLLTTLFIVTASDGYQVAISGGELDPAFGNVPIYIAWEQDGEPLANTEDGPFRLVVPGDTKGGRYVSGIVSIEIVTLETMPHEH